MPLPLVALALPGALKLASGVLGALAGASEAKPPPDKARAAANDFEAMFLEQSLERVVAGTGAEGPLGANGTGGEVYRSMYAKELAGKISRSGGIGIADQVYREMLRLQEARGGQRS